jgi:hypothetical protein
MKQEEQYYGARQPQKGKERIEHLLRGRYPHVQLTNKETTVHSPFQGFDL